MAKGTIRWFDESKGFGFITPDSGGRDLFFQILHVDAGDAPLRDGLRVEFEEGLGRKGPEALHVKPLS